MKITRATYFFGILFLFLITGLVMINSKVKSNHMLTIALLGTWGPLSPPEQSSHNAEFVLANTFETLVNIDNKGNLIPLLSKSWEISSDFKQITFWLDTSRRFSNGQNLTAEIFKAALENSLLVPPASANSSSLDILYKIDGFDEFYKTKKLSGIVAASEEKLIFQFTSPFRQALFELNGIRFAAYIQDHNGNYIGTGPHIIVSKNTHVVKFDKNPFWQGEIQCEKAEIHAIEKDMKVSALKNEFDVYLFRNTPPDTNLVTDCGQLFRTKFYLPG